MKECLKGNHPLQTILRSAIDDSEDYVVRWCTHCGCVVIDHEVDCRRIGAKMRMRAPATYYEIKEAQQ